MKGRILFVDDEPNILSGFERLFRKDYDVRTAPGGSEGLEAIAAAGPFAVVLSDMRMPHMGGAEFLARVREVSPDSVRMVLTGETDIGSAMRAVNEGAIFRFLLKPCAEPALRGALDAALRQHQLQFAERDLLEKTLRGSVKVLADVLSLVNPAAFGRSVRIQRYVQHIAAKLGLQQTWEFEVAALLSQIGCVTLPPRTLEAVFAGERLDAEEEQRYKQHTSVAHDLLAHVPRLESVARMIAGQDDVCMSPVTADDPVTLGAQMLRVCLAFDQLVARGETVEGALASLTHSGQQYNGRLLSALEDIHFESVTYRAMVVPVRKLQTGMVIDEDVRAQTGLLLVARGQEATFPMLVRLKNFHQNGAIADTIRVLVLRASLGAEAPQLAGAAAHVS